MATTRLVSRAAPPETSSTQTPRAATKPPTGIITTATSREASSRRGWRRSSARTTTGRRRSPSPPHRAGAHRTGRAPRAAQQARLEAQQPAPVDRRAPLLLRLELVGERIDLL